MKLIPPLRGRVEWLLLPIVLLGLLLRLYVWWQAPRPGFVIDEAEYYQGALTLAGGRGWQFYETFIWLRPPLYPLLLTGSLLAGGYNLVIIRLVQIALSLASILLLYRLAKSTFDQRTALLTALIASLGWTYAVFSYLLLSETLFIFLMLVAINLLTAWLAQANSALPTVPGKINGWGLPVPATKLLLAGGAVLGLAALTRGQALSFLPVVGLWLWWGLSRHQPKSLVPALAALAVLLVAFGLVVTPWAGRSWLVYGRPLLDTTGGYNFYLGALGNRDEPRLNAELLTFANPAERENFAYSQGLKIATANPFAFITKGIKEAGDFFSLNFGAAERLENNYSKGEISPTWLLPSLILGDLWYILVGCLAIVGLVVAHPTVSNGLRSLAVLWLGYSVALSFVFFAVSRFRAPVMLLLVIFAAWVLAHPRQVVVGLKQSKKLKLPLAIITLAGFLALVIPGFAPGETVRGLEEWNNRQFYLQGEEFRLAGKPAEALPYYARANPKVQATQIAIALAEAQQGNYDPAIRRLEAVTPESAPQKLALGWVYARQGRLDFASSENRTRPVASDPTADEWAAHNLLLSPLPANTLNIGEFDWGYLQGFHYYEREDSRSPYYRWSEGRNEQGRAISWLRFPGVTDAPRSLQLELRVIRPPGVALPAVTLRLDNQVLGTVTPDANWQFYTIALPPNIPVGSIELELECSATFVPDGISRRELGFMLRQAKLVS